MRLIIGIGNSGEEYKNNRHNVGHKVVDKILKTPAFAEATAGKQKSEQVKIFKSQNFMNESGVFIRHLISQYPNILISDLYIIHDDLDIKLGDYKIQKGRGPKDHNGILSIEKELGSKDFWRVRVGIENRDPQNRISGDDYVLQDFTKEEIGILEKVIKKAVNELVQKTMNHEQ